MTSQVAILIPVLDRPASVIPVAESALANTPGSIVLFIATAGYNAEADACTQAMTDHPNQVWWSQLPDHRGNGDYARKINLGIQATAQPYLFFGADDLRFHPGWFEAAAARMTEQVGVVGTNDMGPWRPNSPSRAAVAAGEHAAHCLVARWYTKLGMIDDPTRMLNESYPHEFVDDEMTATARYRGAWDYAADSKVEHLHPHFGKGQTDASYQAAAQRIPPGRVLYRSRAHLWGEDPPKR